ncbi:MAG: hypothetical protein M9963_09225 [Kiritimatiellae bacterium]|nr:hypothetical protein [Kiritimatiellia bacterium]MCO5062155.1 hypothetical protein [Kiritimatiellia bacterium]
MEITETGRRLFDRLAQAAGQSSRARTCDLRTGAIDADDIPPDSVWFTSYAVSCLPDLNERYIRSLLERRPRVVIHFEPCYEHCSSATLLGLLRRRYIEVNDYNRNLVTLLRSMEATGEVQILNETPAAFGMNPLFAASVVAWRGTESVP